MAAVAVGMHSIFGVEPGSTGGSEGDRGSDDRTAWCNAKHLKWLGEVEKNCTKDYPDGGTSLDACLHGGADSCNSSWGGKSDCETRKILTNGGSGLVPRKRLQQEKTPESQKGILGKPLLGKKQPNVR